MMWHMVGFWFWIFWLVRRERKVESEGERRFGGRGYEGLINGCSCFRVGLNFFVLLFDYA